MADTLVPDHVDARKIFSKGASIAGILPVSQLKRLSQSLSNDEGLVQAELLFTVDEGRRRVVSGHVKARVNAICQRCLEAVAIDLEDTVHLALVETDEHVRKLPPELDPWYCTTANLDLPDIIEEQLILCMPLVSNHADGECTGEAALIRAQRYSADSEASAETAKAQGPFAALQSLKDKDKQ